MRLALAMLALTGAMFALGSCAVTSTLRQGVVDSFCEARDGWTPIPPPADAQSFRDALARDADYAADRQYPEYWFTRADGDVRLCLTPLTRGEYEHPRWRGCDTRVATWWDFQRTQNGPHTDGAEERICVL